MDKRLPEIITFKQFSSLYEWPSESALRSYYFRRKDNGLSDAFFSIGRRVLVDPKKLFSLITKLDAERKEKERSKLD